MTYVYILKLKNSQLYKGVTSDLKRRISEHRSGRVLTTAKNLPISLIAYEAYLKESDAVRRERFLKTTEGRRLLRQQYRDAIQQ